MGRVAVVAMPLLLNSSIMFNEIMYATTTREIQFASCRCWLRCRTVKGEKRHLQKNLWNIFCLEIFSKASHLCRKYFCCGFCT